MAFIFFIGSFYQHCWAPSFPRSKGKWNSNFGMTIDQVVHFDNQPAEVTIQDKPSFEQVNLIGQLDEEDRTVVFKIIDTMLTKKKFKDFLTTTLPLYSGLI